MTNFEKLKEISVEEMAKILIDFALMKNTKKFCIRPCLQDGKERICTECMQIWLESDVHDGD